MLKISFSLPVLPTQHAVIVTVADKQKLGEQGTKLDRKLGGAIKRAMAAASFTGAAEKTLTIVAPAKSRLSRIVLVGIGDPAKTDAGVLMNVGGAACAALGNKDVQASLIVDAFKGMALSAGEASAQAAYGVRLRSYRFDKYRTKLKADQKPQLKNVTVMTADAATAKSLFASLEKVAEGVYLTRNVVSEPPNVIVPQTLAEVCVGLKDSGVKVEVLDEKKMKALGMGSLLGVAQGSDNPPRMVVMSWNGGAADEKPVMFIGKGVTFDSGGLSLKPAEGMERMKYDMAGAGAVIGAMKALAGRKAKANVVGIVGLVENMPSGNAQRPGDVVTSMSGQTIEVLNTDAEGRLVLADVLWYGQEHFKPRCIIDLATLTGAIVVALGHEYAGLFSNDDALSDQLTKAGQESGEKLWRFPMGDSYDRQLDSPIADMKNIGNRGESGSITAAQFLQRFIKKGVAWAHLDIAGMAWAFEPRPTVPKGASAYGVRLLNQFVADNFEAK